jgi:hypothetical protein
MPINDLCMYQQLFQFSQKLLIIALKRRGIHHNDQPPTPGHIRQKIAKCCFNLTFNPIPVDGPLADLVADGYPKARRLRALLRRCVVVQCSQGENVALTPQSMPINGAEIFALPKSILGSKRHNRY